MDIRGVVVSFTDKSGVSKAGKEFNKAELVIKNNDGYNDKEVHYAFTLFGKAMENYSQKVGDKVEVMFNIESRQWKDRWFTELVAWKVNMTVGDSAPSQEMANDDAPF
jgi:peptidoglycan/xylan/chitin deacetylase (PgdA/CDA1 family)